jgi:protein-arginine kinase activator protein McsA
MVIGWKKKKEEKVEPGKKFKCSLCGATFREPEAGNKRCPECYAEGTVGELIE